MKTDTQLLEKLIEFLSLKDREALEFWMNNVYFGYEYDTGDMINDGEGLRAYTPEEIAERRAKRAAYRKRMEHGDGTPTELLSWKVLQSYQSHMIDSIFIYGTRDNDTT